MIFLRKIFVNGIAAIFHASFHYKVCYISLKYCYIFKMDLIHLFLKKCTPYTHFYFNSYPQYYNGNLLQPHLNRNEARLLTYLLIYLFTN